MVKTKMICPKCKYDKAIQLFTSIACDKCDGRIGGVPKWVFDIIDKNTGFFGVNQHCLVIEVRISNKTAMAWCLGDISLFSKTFENYREVLFTTFVDYADGFDHEHDDIVRFFARHPNKYNDYVDFHLDGTRL